ncbi:Single-stranded-DNA-specific exonuclease RecJ [Sinobacterium norvegicum]|uniref:Single-stranded-DNA-specific exonuclease RecJ n=1 Tax=Sinobacterium norvegicum TaxID=1641715 RepID=A0ABM9ADK4_9GAMM|nr:single-stranded-DNA-specific exonuclease RecJ [Sinobacterium norvegicum]CAH0990780.1 Single-stranded-DNA-specific exonuclease RecJ [Sinobacterium norvegicum]
MSKTVRRRSADDKAIESLMAEGVEPLLARIYASRKINATVELERQLAGMLMPATFKGMDSAVAILVEAVEQQRQIVIVGDYDADGATSSALSILALRAMGLASVTYLVPNRFTHGYGLTPRLVDEAKALGAELLITVDNGIAAIAGVEAAHAAGMKVVVTDHHLPGDTLPAADAIVNPSQPGCGFASKNIAGVGVIFYVMAALRAALVARGWFSNQGMAVPNMADYLDIVALGTVADVVPLDRNNRILVHQGLARIRAGKARPGILHILELAKRSYHRVVASDMGFAIGPRLNAAGRLDDMSLGVECLLTSDAIRAAEIAAELDGLNQDRKSIEGSMQQEADQALARLQVDEAELPWGVCLFDKTWHEGVIGILASRIKDKHHRPVIIFAQGDDGGVKGSARSIAGFHMRDAIAAIDAKNPGLIHKFGGHAMAAGLTIAPENYNLFSQLFDQQARNTLDEDELQAVVLSDGELGPEQFTLDLAHRLREAGPWGQRFAEPVFDGEFTLVQQRLVGGSHLKMVLAPSGFDGMLIDAIAFNIDPKQWPNLDVNRVSLAYKLDINEFRGKQTVQLLVDYLAVA